MNVQNLPCIRISVYLRLLQILLTQLVTVQLLKHNLRKKALPDNLTNCLIL